MHTYLSPYTRANAAIASSKSDAVAAYDRAKAEGRIWSLGLLQSQDGSSLQLMHDI